MDSSPPRPPFPDSSLRHIFYSLSSPLYCYSLINIHLFTYIHTTHIITPRLCTPRIPVPGARVVVAGSWCPGGRCRFLVPGWPLPAPGARVVVAGSRVAVAGSWCPGGRCRLLVPGWPLPVPGWSLPAPGARVAVAGIPGLCTPRIPALCRVPVSHNTSTYLSP